MEEKQEMKILRATHQGPIEIGEKELMCAVLEDGTRIISRTAIFRALGRTQRGRKKDEIRVLNMPAFIDANNLQPFIGEELSAQLTPIEYHNVRGALTTGYKAEILPLICEVYLSARESGALTKQQYPLAVASEMLVRSLSKLGIIALIDEATGYQEAREQDALQRLLSVYLTDERLKWAKMFPNEFYKQLFRLKKWDYNPMDVRRPKIVGRLTNQLVYEKLPPGVIDELRRLNPVKNKKTYRRGATHHQYLSVDIGQDDLRSHLLQLIAIMRISPNWDTFIMHFKHAFPGDNEQIELDLED